MAIAELPMTIEEFLNLPEDGVDRELIAGQIRVHGTAIRDRGHARTLANLCFQIGRWNEFHDHYRVLAGNAGFILHDEPATVLGIDLAVIDADAPSRQTSMGPLMVGVPRLVIEVLSLTDSVAAINEKTRLYLDHGTPWVWWVDPTGQTIRVIGQDRIPVTYLNGQDLSDERILPGLKLALSEIFE